MRNIKDCYKRLKVNEDIVKHGDMVNSSYNTNFYLNGYSLHYGKSSSKVTLSEKNPYKIGINAWTNSLFRRIKS